MLHVDRTSSNNGLLSLSDYPQTPSSSLGPGLYNTEYDAPPSQLHTAAPD